MTNLQSRSQLNFGIMILDGIAGYGECTTMTLTLPGVRPFGPSPPIPTPDRWRCMHSHDEFWLQLHDLESNLNSDDLPVENKAEKLGGYLVQYPPVARQQIEC